MLPAVFCRLRSDKHAIADHGNETLENSNMAVCCVHSSNEILLYFLNLHPALIVNKVDLHLRWSLLKISKLRNSER